MCLSGTLIARHFERDEWRGVYQVPMSVMSERDIERCEALGMEVESQSYSHHDDGSWWRVTWLPTVATAEWTWATQKIRADFMSLPVA